MGFRVFALKEDFKRLERDELNLLARILENLVDGMDLIDFSLKVARKEPVRRIIKEMLSEGLIEGRGGKVFLTSEGMDFLDKVLEERETYQRAREEAIREVFESIKERLPGVSPDSIRVSLRRSVFPSEEDKVVLFFSAGFRDPLRFRAEGTCLVDTLEEPPRLESLTVRELSWPEQDSIPEHSARRIPNDVRVVLEEKVSQAVEKEIERIAREERKRR